MPPEKVRPREVFTFRERSQLLDEMYDRSKWLMGNLAFNRPDLEPYAELISVVGILEEELRLRAASHLRQIAALAARTLPEPTATPGDMQFWEKAQKMVGPSWEKAQSFAEDLSDVPRSWQRAREDFMVLRSELRRDRE